MQLVDEFRRLVGQQRGVEKQDAGLGGDQQVGGVQRIVGAPDALAAVEGMLQQLEQCHVLGEDDDVRARLGDGGFRVAGLNFFRRDAGRAGCPAQDPCSATVPGAAQRLSTARIPTPGSPTRAIFDNFCRG